MNQAAITRLENWAVFQFGIGRRFRLSGDVTNHPDMKRNPDGSNVTTTHVVAYNPDNDVAITSSGTRYKLGKPYGNSGDAYWQRLRSLNLPKEL